MSPQLKSGLYLPVAINVKRKLRQVVHFCTGHRSGQVYRCDSQGTVDSSTESDSTTLNDLSGRLIDGNQLSDSSGYDLLDVGVSGLHEDEQSTGGAVSEPDMLPSLQRRRRRRRQRRMRRSDEEGRRQRTVVVVKQPKIDLDKMVVVAFDKLQASGGQQESVAVQTSPPDEEEADSKALSDSQKRPTNNRGSGFWRKGKASSEDKSGKKHNGRWRVTSVLSSKSFALAIA